MTFTKSERFAKETRKIVCYSLKTVKTKSKLLYRYPRVLLRNMQLVKLEPCVPLHGPFEKLALPYSIGVPLFLAEIDHVYSVLLTRVY